MIPEVEQALGFRCVTPIQTVYSYLKDRESLELLHDDNIAMATREINSEFKSRDQIQIEIQRKRLAIETLCNTYANDRISAQDIERCLSSISDNHAYLKSNR